MLPVSGAEQLNAIGAIAGERPISSQSTPYSQLVRPGPKLVIRQEQVPEAVGLGSLAQLADDLRIGDAGAGADLVVERPHRLELHGQHLIVDERPHAVAKLDDARGQVEVHALGSATALRRARSPAGGPCAVPAGVRDHLGGEQRAHHQASRSPIAGTTTPGLPP